MTVFLFLCRHKKEKKREKERDRRSDKERVREERERSTSRKKKSKDKERERERKSDGEKDVKVGCLQAARLVRRSRWSRESHDDLFPQITRDYDEEEQGYDSEKDRQDRKGSDDSGLSPHSDGNGTGRHVKQAKVNGADDHHEEDMDVSD